MEKFAFTSTLAQKPVFNHTNKTIIVSDKFYRAAKDPTNNESYDLMKLRQLYPGYEITTRSHRKPRNTKKTQNIPKFVPYDKMEQYIRLLPDCANLLKQFEMAKLYAESHGNKAYIVFNWFNDTFPDYRKAPKVDREGNLIATVNVVNFSDYKKPVKEKEQAKETAEPPQADPLDAESTNELKNVI